MDESKNKLGINVKTSKSKEKGQEVKTGWPAGLLQDDHRGLFDWFANRADSRRQVRLVCFQITKERECM